MTIPVDAAACPAVVKDKPNDEATTRKGAVMPDPGGSAVNTGGPAPFAQQHGQDFGTQQGDKAGHDTAQQ
jgi:hypothetical protein